RPRPSLDRLTTVGPRIRAHITVCRPIVRAGGGRPLRRGLPLVVASEPLPREPARLVRLEPGAAAARLHPGDGPGVDAGRRGVRPRDGRPVPIEREVGPIVVDALVAAGGGAELDPREYPAGGKVRECRIARLHLVDER